ncbi:MAG: helix-turn-helix transcriptional regulator [Marinicella sp.]
MPKIIATEKPDHSRKVDFKWLGQYVRHKRTSMGIGLADAASLCGLSKNAYSNIELGKSAKVETLFIVLNNMGIELSVVEHEDDIWN